MKRRIMATLLLLLSLSACATSEKYNTQLNKDIGKSYQQIISQYGEPTGIQQLANGDKILTYVNVNSTVVPAPNYYFNTTFMTEDEMFYPFTYGGDDIPISNYMGQVVTDYCKTKFYLKNNVVNSWQWRGNACVAM